MVHDDGDVPALGVGVLRTCRRVYYEVDMSPLYAANTFRFTRPMIASWWMNHITPSERDLVRGITCDLSTIDYHGCAVNAGPSGSTLVREWQHYLRCTPNIHDVCRDCIYQPEMLVADMPKTESLALDATSLQDQAYRFTNTTFDKGAVQKVLLNLLVGFFDAHCGTAWLAHFKGIRVTGRDLYGNVVHLGMGNECLHGELALQCSHYNLDTGHPAGGIVV